MDFKYNIRKGLTLGIVYTLNNRVIDALNVMQWEISLDKPLSCAYHTDVVTCCLYDFEQIKTRVLNKKFAN